MYLITDLLISSKTNMPRGYMYMYKVFLVLNSAEYKIFCAKKYENANNSWHFHIY